MMPGEVDPAVAAYMEARRAEILSVIPQLEEALEEARRKGNVNQVRELTLTLRGSEDSLSLEEFPELQEIVLGDVLWVADQLMAHEDFRPMLERVGVHGDLTETERKALEGQVKALLQGQRGWDDGDWHWGGPSNAWAAIALVRRVLAGVYEDLRMPQAIEFIDYNANYNIFMEKFKTFKSIAFFPAHIDEIIFVAKGLISDQEMVEMMRTILKTYPYEERDKFYNVISRFVYNNYLTKYGWMSKTGIKNLPLFILQQHVKGELSFCREKIVEILSFSISESFFEWMRNKAVKSARSWGPNHVIEDCADR